MGLQIYDFVSFFFTIMLDIFFREIRPRGAHKIPQKGPVIFVAAPHANQVLIAASLIPHMAKRKTMTRGQRTSLDRLWRSADVGSTTRMDKEE
jgi:glycerol-3-phosphate O-acyltransferase/dihydroxyacetone phosphate acyltransferase